MRISKLMKGSLNPFDLIRSIKFKMAFRKEHPDFFDPEGILIFCGAQGEGKTYSAVEYVINVANEYPKSILCTNVDLDKSLFPEGYDIREYTGLDDLKTISNGYAGVIYLIDEIQLELNSLESKNISIDQMIEFCQARKQRKHIVGTSQVYSRMAKPLREQVRNIVMCNNFFGLIQFNKFIDAFRTAETSSGKLKVTVRKRLLFFHRTKIYKAYDTYAKMRRYREEWNGMRRFTEVI